MSALFPTRFALVALVAVLGSSPAGAQFVAPFAEPEAPLPELYGCRPEPLEQQPWSDVVFNNVTSDPPAVPTGPDVLPRTRAGQRLLGSTEARQPLSRARLSDEPCPTSSRREVWAFEGGWDVRNVDEWSVTFGAAGRIAVRTDRRGYTDESGNEAVSETVWTYTYDASGNLVEERAAFDSDPAYSVLYAYDASGRLVSAAYDDGDDSERVTITYGAGLSPTEIEGDGTEGRGRYLLTYDAAGRLLTVTEEDYNASFSDWDPDERTVYAYDGAGRAVQEDSEFWSESRQAWGLESRIVYAYGANGYAESAVYLDDRGTETSRTDYSFDAAGRLLSVQSSRRGTPSYRRFYTYDGDRVVEEVSEQYDEPFNDRPGGWTFGYRSLFVRDSGGRAVEWVEQRRDAPADPWTNSQRYLYGYDVTVDGERTPDSVSLALSASPNPVAGAATIRFQLDRPASVRLTVFDALGREAAHVAAGDLPAGPHALPFDAGALAPGFYVVRLVSGASVAAWPLTVAR